METKICTKCNQELPINDFNWRDKKKGTRRSECKYCHTKYMKETYETKRSIVSDIKSQMKCKKCGENRYYVLDFHHLDPSEKEATVARMVSNNYQLEKTLQEIEKCIVLCSNCHREFHYLNDSYDITIDDYLNDNYLARCQ
jgi:hypothetical protein